MARLDVVTRVGAVMVAVGALATVLTLLPLSTGLEPMPVAVYVLCFFAPLGLGVILVALWRRARGRRARLLAAEAAGRRQGA